MSVALRYAARSNIGLGRYKNNQDSGFAGPHVLAVCDGMGGHAGGDIASSIAIGHLAELDTESIGADAPQVLVRTIRDAHAEMLERVSADPQLTGMGTTVTALLKYGGRLALAHIGDSRAYVLSGGSFTQVTKDHTFVQWLVDQGSITEEEAEVHPQRSVITRVLGDADASDEIDTSVREAIIGDRWLLCSDGLSGPVSNETLAETLRTIDDPGECAEKLIDLALRGGGQDNITCVVADIVSATDATANNHQVVGAASIITSDDIPTTSAAAKARALTEPTPAPVEEVPPEPTNWWQSQWLRKFFLFLAVFAVVGAIALGAYAGYRWSQQQYYVGVADDKVAIYRGLPQPLGPFELSEVYSVQDIELKHLSDSARTDVENTIAVDDLATAENTVVAILKASKLCEVAETTEPAPQQTPAPEPTAEPTDAPPTGTDETRNPLETPTPEESTTPTVLRNIYGDVLRKECGTP